eukprot:1365526-Rhodomonas_salina.1
MVRYARCRMRVQGWYSGVVWGVGRLSGTNKPGTKVQYGSMRLVLRCGMGVQGGCGGSTASAGAGGAARGPR